MDRSALRPLVVAALLGALAEGVVAAFQAIAAGAGIGSALAAWLGAAGVLLLPLLVGAVAVGWIVERAPVRRLASGLRAGLGGPEGHAGVALLVVAIAAVAAIGAGAAAGMGLGRLMTERFATAGAAIVTLAVAAAALVVLSFGAALLGRALRGAAARAPRLARLADPPAILVLAGVATAIAVAAAMPAAYAVAPAVLVASLGVAIVPEVGARLARALPPRRFAIATLIALVVAVAVPALLEALPAAAQNAVAYRAPWSSLLIGAGQRALDGDGDGYAPILLGGDCDDASAEVNPAARDVPGNGVDENCSGRDARLYRPPAAPPHARPAGLPARNNVVVVLVDALRPDHLHFAGYARRTSPRLDRFQRGAVWYRHAYTTAPSTRFALTSAFTGLDVRRVPHRRGAGNSFDLDPRAVTMGELLAPRGFKRVGWTITYVLDHNRGLEQGWETWNTPFPREDWLRTYPIAAELTTRASIATLAATPADGSRPYLLFAHYRCTHDPYFDYPRWHFGDSDLDRYDSSLAYCDDEIGKLLDAIAARPDAGRTAILVLSDHGELFGEHGLTNHGNSVFEPDVRIVMMLQAPGLRPRIEETPVSLADLAPTVLELAGAPVPRDLDGWSLLVHEDAREPPRRPLFAFTDIWRGSVHHEASMVLDWPLKLIRDRRLDLEALYDVQADPHETRDLGDARPEDRSRLVELLEGYEAGLEN